MSNSESKPTEFEKLKVQYEENSRLMHTFFDWRHKVLYNYLITVGAILLSIQWIYANTNKRYIVISLFLGLLSSLLALFMDKVNQSIIDICYRVGRNLETIMFPDLTISVYREMSNRFNNKNKTKYITYRMVLGVLYLTMSIVFAVSIFLAMHFLPAN